MKYFLDAEFIEDGHTVDLVSIGIVTDDHRHLYLESAEADLGRANAWVQMHVLPKFGPVEQRVTRAAIRRAILDLVGRDDDVLFVADCAAYDWLCVCQLFGQMVDLPPSFPYFCLDLQQLIWAHPERRRIEAWLRATDRPAAQAHHAYLDAIWLQWAWDCVAAPRWDPPAFEMPQATPIAEVEALAPTTQLPHHSGAWWSAPRHRWPPLPVEGDLEADEPHDDIDAGEHSE